MPRLAVLLLLVAGPAFAQKAPAEIIRLTFNWPVPTKARVELTATRIKRTDGERTDSTTLRTTYTLHVGKHPTGLTISTRDYALAPGPATPEVAAQLSTLAPAYIVSHAGEVTGLVDEERLLRRYRSAFSISDSARAANPEGALAAEQMINRDLLLNSVMQEWNTAVGFWIDAELEMGITYTLESEGPSPLVPGAVIPTTVEFAVLDRVPCMEQNVKPACVLIALDSFPDEDVVQQTVDRFFAMLAPADAQPKIRSVAVMTGATLVVDPATLRTYWMETYKSGTTVTEASDGTEVVSSQDDVKTYTYTYENR